MKYLPLAALLLLAAVPSYAQQLIEVNLKISTTEADLIWKGLRKLPVEDVENLMTKIRQQVMDQTTPKPVETPKPEEKK